VRLRSSASAYLDRTFTTPTSRRIFTLSAWTKRGALGTTSAILGNAGTREVIGFFGNTTGNGDALHFRDTSGGAYEVTTTAVFRDPSAWYHVVVAFDTTQATASNRVKMYVNGVQQTSFAVATYPSQNADLNLNSAVVHAIGRRGDAAAYYFDGYLTEINFIDGQALTPSSFGETDAITGVWKPKKYTGTYGTNGFFLNFSDNSNNTAATIGKDYSGNGNNWTPNNISVTSGSTYDSMLDVPTQWADGGNGRGNYCTLNPLKSYGGLNSANLGQYNATANWTTGTSTFYVSTGKWYWEVLYTNLTGSTYGMTGIVDNNFAQQTLGNYPGVSATSYAYYNADGKKYNAGAGATYGATYADNDVIGIALDMDAGTLTFYKNGVSQGTAFTGLSGTFTPAVGTYGSVGNINFGQRPFSYTPPSGFKALNTLNLPAPTILKGNQYFDATLYTGNNSTLSVTNSGSMQPDLVWIKGRSQSSNNVLQDAVRGANRYLISNGTGAEGTDGSVTAFNSNGFSLTTDAGVSFNANGTTYVGWQWKEGATQGFDIVTYTGTGVARTVAHNLGVAPSMIIVKNRNTSSYGWFVWHTAFGAAGNTDYINLNLTDAKGSGGAVSMWNNTMPTSSVFSLGTYAGVNANGNNYVAYLFAAVAGYSAFGSYTGNGSADGTFVFCGFRPRFILIKESTPNARGWRIFDTARSPFNQAGLTLSPNTADAEDTGSGLYNQMDILSNGFKLRAGTNSEPTNESGATYIYAAFAENPLKFSLAR